MPEGIRFDRAVIGPSWEKTPEGFLRVKATFARTGLQRYRNADGSTRIELRPEDEIARKDALASLGGLPVTLEHPPALLTPDTCSQYQRGQSGSVVNYDSGFVQGTITLTDREAIEAVERGDAREVSVGYRVHFDATPGVYHGQRYDGVQRQVSGNHIAVVRQARGGSELRLHLDSADSDEPDVAVAVDLIDSNDNPPEDNPMAHQRSDAGKKPPAPMAAPQDEWEEAGEGDEEENNDTEGTGEEEESGPPSSRGRRGDMGGMGKKPGTACDHLDGAETVPYSLYEKALQERDDALEQLEIAWGESDAIAERIDDLEDLINQRLDSQSEVDIDAAVHARLGLIDKAQKLTGPQPVDHYDGLSDRDVILDALEAAGFDPDRFDGRSDDYVVSAFETVIEGPTAAAREDGATSLLRVLNAGLASREDSGAPSIEEAQRQMIERTAKAHAAS